MADLGRFNLLTVTRRSDFGLFLDGESFGEVLLPKRFVEPAMQPGDQLSVFLYNDSEDRIVATTEIPKVRVGECAYLRVVSVDRIGAFLDWGLGKDLFVPYGEQQKTMQKGYSYAVYVFVDQATRRIVASSRLERHLPGDAGGYRPGDPVELLIYGRSDLGFKAIIDNRRLGQLYQNETFRPLHYGERVSGYVKQVRRDGKIDLALQLASRGDRDQLQKAILEYLARHDGFSTLTDYSPPDEIYNVFGVSKAKYKKALGHLYRERRIRIEEERIVLLD